MTYDKEITKYLKETHNIEPTPEQLAEICNKEELVSLIKQGVFIEWEWTVVLTTTCCSCCSDGAISWVRDNLRQIYPKFEVIWSSSWQEVE